LKLSTRQIAILLKGTNVIMANIFEAKPIEGGYSWTIISKLSNIINVVQYVKENNHVKYYAEEPNYINAYNLANNFLSIDPDIIKKLREAEPAISLITKDLILDINPDIQQDLIEKLLTPFQ
jgi:hypothetical protein